MKDLVSTDGPGSSGVSLSPHAATVNFGSPGITSLQDDWGRPRYRHDSTYARGGAGAGLFTDRSTPVIPAPLVRDCRPATSLQSPFKCRT